MGKCNIHAQTVTSVCNVLATCKEPAQRTCLGDSCSGQTGLHNFSCLLLNPLQNHRMETVKKINTKRKRSALTRRSLWYRTSLSSRELVFKYPDKKANVSSFFNFNVSFNILAKQVTCRCQFLLLYPLTFWHRSFTFNSNKLPN